MYALYKARPVDAEQRIHGLQQNAEALPRYTDSGTHRIAVALQCRADCGRYGSLERRGGHAQGRSSAWWQCGASHSAGSTGVCRLGSRAPRPQTVRGEHWGSLRLAQRNRSPERLPAHQRCLQPRRESTCVGTVPSDSMQHKSACKHVPSAR